VFDTLVDNGVEVVLNDSHFACGVVDEVIFVLLVVVFISDGINDHPHQLHDVEARQNDHEYVEQD